jgi:hypothetical protein
MIHVIAGVVKNIKNVVYNREGDELNPLKQHIRGDQTNTFANSG